MAFQTPRRERPDPAALDLADGTVTRVVQQQKDPDRVSVYLDGRFAFGLSLPLAVEHGLRKGLALTAERQRELLTAQETHAARAAALASLAARARTTGEIRKMLAAKGFDDHTADDTVAALEAMGVVDDAAYAVAYARGRFAGRGHGPTRIRQDLQSRGVAPEHIDAALAELDDTEDVAERARRDAAGRWSALAGEPDARKRKKKTLDFLLRRGHAFDVARAAVDAAADASDDDYGEPSVDSDGYGWQ